MFSKVGEEGKIWDISTRCMCCINGKRKIQLTFAADEASRTILVQRKTLIRISRYELLAMRSMVVSDDAFDHIPYLLGDECGDAWCTFLIDYVASPTWTKLV